MRIARIATVEGMTFCSVEGEGDDIVCRQIDGHPFGEPTLTGKEWPLADVRLLAPILACLLYTSPSPRDS